MSLEDMSNNIDESVWDHDISSFIWHEFPQDLSSLMDSKQSRVETEDMLSLKVNGFTPAIKRYLTLFYVESAFALLMKIWLNG